MNKFLGRLTSSSKRVKLTAAIGIAGIVLILLSELIPAKKPSQKTGTNAAAQDETLVYKKQLEQELTELISHIDGAGECRIMITLEGTTEYIYAENVSRYSDTDGTKLSEKYDGSIVFSDSGGSRQALVRKVIRPQITGVLIVCSGGGDTAVRERVMRAASAALGLSTARICVEKLR
ncbi:MAG: stage III sporulation protein AG [Ruminococcus sp.]|nr:stage III sporulation protein AG [Ruminococcus sp.]